MYCFLGGIFVIRCILETQVVVLESWIHPYILLRHDDFSTCYKIAWVLELHNIYAKTENESKTKFATAEKASHGQIQ